MSAAHRTLRIASTWDGQPLTDAEQIVVELQREGQGVRVRVDAPFHGDPAPPGPPTSTDGLWEYEVVEVMFADGSDRYLEIELSPHGHWLCLHLEGVRRVVSSGHRVDHNAQIADGR